MDGPRLILLIIIFPCSEAHKMRTCFLIVVRGHAPIGCLAPHVDVGHEEI